VSPFVVVFYGLLYEDLKKAKAGQEIPESTTGRKAKYLLTSAAGFIVGLVLTSLVLVSLAKRLNNINLDENNLILPTPTSQETGIPEITE
jgi:hypothetical protein